MIAALADRWRREGPGIDPDAPPATGLARLGTTLWREMWDMFLLNLIIAALSVPVVTIPAAHAAATRVAILMLQDQPIYLFRTYFSAFRRLFWPATAIGLLAAAALGLCAYGIWIYGQLALHQAIYTAPLMLAVCAALLTGIVALHAMVLLALAPDRPRLARRAMLAALARPLPALGGIAAVAGLWLVHVLFHPVSALMPATGLFSVGVLVATFAVLGTAAPPTPRPPASMSEEETS